MIRLRLAAGAACALFFLPAVGETTYYTSGDNTTVQLNVPAEATWSGCSAGYGPKLDNETKGRSTALALSAGSSFGLAGNYQYFQLAAATNQWLEALTGDARRYLRFGMAANSTLRSAGGGSLYLANPNGFRGIIGYGGWGHGVSLGSTSGLKRQGLVLTPTETFTPVVHNLETFARVHLASASGVATTLVENVIGPGVFDINYKHNFSQQTFSDGIVEIVNAPGARSAAYLQGGRLILNGVPSDMPDALVEGPEVHFDASVAASLKSDTQGVTLWQDLSGNGHDARPYSAHARYVRNAAGPGLPAVDFGAFFAAAGTIGTTLSQAVRARYGEPAGLQLTTPARGLREVFVVWHQNQRMQSQASPIGGSEDGAEGSTGDGACFYLREGDLRDGLLCGKSAHTVGVFAGGEVRWDGQRVPPAATLSDYADGFHVLSVSTAGEAGHIRFLGMNMAGRLTVGGAQVAEVVAYARTLTPDERRQVNAHLLRKWRAGRDGEDLELGAVLTAGSSVQLDVPEGRTARIGTVATRGTSLQVVKTGGGRLEIGCLYPVGSPIEVQEGTVALTGRSAPEPKLAEGASLHLDATQIAAEDTEVSGSRTYLNVWRSTVGTAAAKPLPMAQNVGYRDVCFPRATVVTDAKSGLRVVDFGTYDSKNYSNKSSGSPASSSGSAYKIFKDAEATGYADSTSFAGTNHEAFVVVRLKNANAQIFSRAINAMAVQRTSGSFVELGTMPALQSAVWELDGQPRAHDGWSDQELSNFHVVSFSSLEPITLDALASDRGYANNGGIQLAEMIVYDHQLTEEERRQTTQYLMKRWLLKDHPDVAVQPAGVYTTEGALVTLEDGAGAGVTIETDGRSVSGVSALPGANASYRIHNQHLEQLLAAATVRLDATMDSKIEYAADSTLDSRTPTPYSPDGFKYVRSWRNVNDSSSTAIYANTSSTNGESTTSVLRRHRYATSWPTVREFTVNGVTRPYMDFGGLSWFFWKTGNVADGPDPNGIPTSNGIGTNCTDSSWMTFNRELAGMEFHIVHGDAHLETIRRETSRRCQYYRNVILGRTNSQASPNVFPGRRGYSRESTGVPVCGQLFAADTTTFAMTGYNLPAEKRPRVWVDNVLTNYTYRPPEEGAVNVYTFVPTNATYGAEKGFSFFNTLACDSYCGYGGARYGEILVYASATNTAEDRALIDAYLLKKWKGVGSGYEVSLGPVTLATGSSVKFETSVGSSFMADSLSGGGTLSLGSFDTLVSGEISLRVLSRMSVECFRVGGSFELPATGTLTVTGTDKLVAGSYTLIAADRLVNSSNFANWNVRLDFPGGDGRVNVTVRGNSIVLSLLPRGFTVNMW